MQKIVIDAAEIITLIWPDYGILTRAQPARLTLMLLLNIQFAQ